MATALSRPAAARLGNASPGACVPAPLLGREPPVGLFRGCGPRHGSVVLVMAGGGCLQPSCLPVPGVPSRRHPAAGWGEGYEGVMERLAKGHTGSPGGEKDTEGTWGGSPLRGRGCAIAVGTRGASLR